MDSQRNRILSAIRGLNIESFPLPDSDGDWIRYDSPIDQFTEVLESVGGNAKRVQNADDLARQIAELPAYQQAKQKCCQVAIASSSSSDSKLDWNVQLDEVDDPHDLASVDFAVCAGRFAVAENAAIWVTDERLHQRAVLFIAQHLALVVPENELVNNMHEAYERLSFEGNAFGCFVSGPSKTADIEQSLVIGAHGARSLTVFLVKDSASCGLQ